MLLRPVVLVCHPVLTRADAFDGLSVGCDVITLIRLFWFHDRRSYLRCVGVLHNSEISIRG